MRTPSHVTRTRPAVVRLGQLLASEPRAWTLTELLSATSDHTITGRAVSEAVILSGLPRVRRSTGTAAFAVPRIGYYFTVEGNQLTDTSGVQTQRHAALDCYRSQFTEQDLVGLHEVIDRYERAQAPTGTTHGERLKVLPVSALHVGLTLPRSPTG